MRFNLFQTISENIQDKFITKEMQYFNEQFNEYFKIEDCLFCYQMMDEGYKPSNSKVKILNEILIKKLEKNEYKYENIVNIKSLNPNTRVLALFKEIPDFYYYSSDYLDKNIKLINEDLIIDVFKEEQYINVLLNQTTVVMKDITKFYEDFESKGKSRQEMADIFEKDIRNLTYISSALIKKDLLTKETVQEIKDLFKNVSDFMENKEKKGYKNKEFNRIVKVNIDSFVKEVAIYQSNNLSKENQKQDLLRRLKSYEARKKPLDEEMKSLIINKEYSIDNLPKESKNKVDRITKLVKSLNSQEVTDFVQERLPIIVKKYFSIDEDYRVSLKNIEGFNAQELMEQSLDNIEKIILAKKEDNNIELITEMSIENRSLKMKSKIA